MTLNNIVWNDDESLDGYKLSKMVDNDNFNYSLVMKAPKGYLASLNLATISPKTLISSSDNFTLGELNVYNKNIEFPTNSDDTNITRYYKVCISDIEVNHNTHDSTSVPSGGINFNVPNPSAFVLTFTASLGGSVIATNEFISIMRPAKQRRTDAPADIRPLSTRFWRSQAGEFIIPSDKTGFTLQVQVRRVGGVNASTASFTLISGIIWIEDAGSGVAI